jgi:hypothetical protein
MKNRSSVCAWFWFGLGALVAFSFLAVSCFGDELPSDGPETEQAMPAPADLPTDEAGILGGDNGRRRGDKGLKPIDPPRFELPNARGSILTRIALSVVLWVVVTLIHIAIIVAIVVVLVRLWKRAAKRKRDTGSFLPTAEDNLFLAAVDIAFKRLEDRHLALTKELQEIEKRRAVAGLTPPVQKEGQ